MNYIDSNGRSRLPHGIIDHAEGADKVVVSAEVQAKLDALFAEGELDKVKAKYKIDLFVNERSASKPYPGIIVVFTNGGFNHGGGDEAVYFCSALVEKNGETKTCSSPIELRWISRHHVVCPTCKNVIKPTELCGQIGFKLTTKQWATVLTKIWVIMGGDADIRLGLMPGSIRRRTQDVLDKTSLSAGDRLNDLRGERKWAIYPLRNIAKDTSAGADLEQRIRAFLAG